MAKWLYAEGNLYNTDCFQRIELCIIDLNDDLWAVRAFYIDNMKAEAYVDLYTGDRTDTIQAQGQIARWLQAPDLDYF